MPSKYNSKKGQIPKEINITQQENIAESSVTSAEFSASVLDTSNAHSLSDAVSTLASALEIFKARFEEDNTEQASTIKSDVHCALAVHFEDITKLISANNVQKNPSVVSAETSAVVHSFETTKNSILRMVDEKLMQFQKKWEEKWTTFTSAMESSIKKIELEADSVQQYGRRACLLLHGLPQESKENLLTIVPRILNEKISLNISSKDLVAVHRLPLPRRHSHNQPANNNSGNNTSPVIIKFVHMHVRNEVFVNKKKLKGSPYTITENLTRRRSALFRDLGYISWSFLGNVFVVDCSNRKRKITTIENLDKFGNSLQKYNNKIARIQFRLPDGSSVTHQFDAGATLNEARQFVVQEVRPGFSSFTFSTTFPRRQFVENDYSQTLRDLDLAPSAAILILPGHAHAPPVPVEAGSGLTNMLMFILSPLFNLWNFVNNFLFGVGAPATGSSTSSGSSTSTNSNTVSSNSNASTSDDPEASNLPSTSHTNVLRNRRSVTNTGNFLRKEGNIFRISNQGNDEDDNNTYNGNSTQQM